MFRNALFSNGGFLAIQAIQSPDFLTGVSGWQIRKDGTVEFNSATFRGTIVVGPTGQSQVTITTQNINGFNQGTISFPTDNADELIPSKIYYTKQTKTLFIEGSANGTLNRQPEVILTGSAVQASNTVEIKAGGTTLFYGHSNNGGTLASQIFDRTTITPVANTPTAQVNTGYGVTGLAPFMGHATPDTSVIGSTVQGVAVSGVTATQLSVWVYRTNTTATGVHFAIIGHQ